MVAPNIFLFTGENAYAMQRELMRWKESFAQKYGQENCERLDGAKITSNELLDSVATLPFLSEKRMVILDGLPKATKEQIQLLVSEIHPDCILVIVEAKPDKRTVVFKAIKDIVTIKSFDPLISNQLNSWIQQECTKSSVSCKPAIAQILLDMVGEDQQQLASELAKLLSYLTPQSSLTTEVIEMLCIPSGEQVIWKLTDLLGKKDIAGALRFLQHRYDRGEDPYGVWVILLNAVKNIATIWMALQESGERDGDISAQTGMHFLSVRGLLPLCKALKRDQLFSLVTFAAQTDIALKSGKLKYTAEQPQEVIIAAERLILHCA